MPLARQEEAGRMSGDREDSEKKEGGVPSQMQRKQDGQYTDRVSKLC